MPWISGVAGPGVESPPIFMVLKFLEKQLAAWVGIQLRSLWGQPRSWSFMASPGSRLLRSCVLLLPSCEAIHASGKSSSIHGPALLADRRRRTSPSLSGPFHNKDGWGWAPESESVPARAEVDRKAADLWWGWAPGTPPGSCSLCHGQTLPPGSSSTGANARLLHLFQLQAAHIPHGSW